VSTKVALAIASNPGPCRRPGSSRPSAPIGADPRIDPGITEPLFELTAPLHDVIPRGPLFHAALDVGADAHIQEKLLALFGRDAAWAPPSAGTGVSGSRTGDGEP
jgi:hypothetical protein